MRDLATFVQLVTQRAQSRAGDPSLHEDQRSLLGETLRRFCRHFDARDPAQPLGLFHLVARARGTSEPRKVIHLAAFCILYTCSLDLFDDMQDGELAGKPHEAAGPAIAVNSAIALLFLALDELRLGMDLETDVLLRPRYLELFNRISLLTVGAQHADLLGDHEVSTPDDVLAMHRGKTASIALFLECAALASGAEVCDVTTYGRLGLDLAGLVQIVDDLRDVYGKEHSADLAQGKCTYPVACFEQTASAAQKSRLAELLRANPVPLDEVRELLHAAEAVDGCARDLEALRVRIHEAVASLNRPCSEHRVLLDIVDALAATIYEPEPIAVTQHLWEPEHEFDRCARQAAQAFARRVGIPREQLPRLAPWHLPYFMFDAERAVIFYPDVDGLADEVLPFHEVALARDRTGTRSALLALLPALLAHELVHALRERAGLLGTDHWHEEYVANRLAVDFLRERDPLEFAALSQLAREVAGENEARLDEHARAILARAPAATVEEAGYGVSLETAAALHWTMVAQLTVEARDLDLGLAQFLELDGLAASAAE